MAKERIKVDLPLHIAPTMHRPSGNDERRDKVSMCEEKIEGVEDFDLSIFAFFFSDIN